MPPERFEIFQKSSSRTWRSSSGIEQADLLISSLHESGGLPESSISDALLRMIFTGVEVSQRQPRDYGGHSRFLYIHRSGGFPLTPRQILTNAQSPLEWRSTLRTLRHCDLNGLFSTTVEVFRGQWHA